VILDPKFIYSVDLGESKSLWNELEYITFPTLIVKGEISKVTSDKDVERMVKLLPNAHR
jgi:pimeloyl-ACP methyl ester carboxylesterase